VPDSSALQPLCCLQLACMQLVLSQLLLVYQLLKPFCLPVLQATY